MPWVVDTCVILDILDRHPEFAEASARALQSHLGDGLEIAPLSYVELAPAFNGDASAQDEFLDALWVRRDFNTGTEEILAAHRAWHEHVLRKRVGASPKRPIADVMIGAYALQKGGLITRNESDFRTLYPALTIFNPVASRP